MMAGPGRPQPDEPGRPPSFEDDTMAINLRRTKLVGLVACGDLIIQAAIGAVREQPALTAMAASGAALMLAFVAAAYAADLIGTKKRTRKAIPLGVVVSLLLLAQILAALGAPLSDRVNGYCIVLLGVSALFKLPPRQFFTIAASSYLLMLLWIALSGMPFGTALQNVGTAAFAMLAAIIIRNLLYRARQRDHEQRMIIADQNRALNQANQELAQQSHEVRETMAIAAHDLRSPMAGLHSLLVLAADRPGMRPDLMRTMLVEAAQSVGTMLDLTGKLVQAHEADDRAPADLERQELLPLVRAAIERIRLSAATRNIRIELAGDGDPLPVLANREAVARIMDNLLSNAVRYSRPGGLVQVLCRRIDMSATVDVLDRGSGIPPADQARIFDKFQRGSGRSMAGSTGAGLGLYIAREAARSIFGQLDYHHRADGGSIFRLTVPIHP